MIKRLALTLGCAALLAVPAFAQDDPAAAQDAPATAQDASVAPATTQDAPSTPRLASNYAKVDYNMADDPQDILLLDLSNGQRVAIRLMPDWAPHHVERVKRLARSGFYNGVIFHRVIDGFMAQTGDPTGTGQGGSDLPDLKAEFNPMPHVRGSVSMARAQSDDSANSQFFIMFYPRFSLDKRYTTFGRVISNMAAVDGIHRGEPPADPTRIVQASIASDDKAPPTQAELSAANAPAAPASIIETPAKDADSGPNEQ